MGSRRAGRGFKRFLEAVGFILAKFEPKPSHGDPIRDQNYGFGMYCILWFYRAKHLLFNRPNSGSIGPHIYCLTDLTPVLSGPTSIV